MTSLEQDKLWAEVQTSEEWARLPEEKPLDFLAKLNAKTIAAEVAQLLSLKKNRFRTPHEL